MSKKLFAIVLGALSLAGSCFAQYQAGAPWPKFQADNANTGRGSSTVHNLALKWSYALGTSPTLASCNPPIIEADGSIRVAMYFSGSGATYLNALTSGGGYDGGWGVSDAITTSLAVGADGTVYAVSTDIGATTNHSVYGYDGFGTDYWQCIVGDVFSCAPTILPAGNVLVLGLGGGTFTVSPGSSGGIPTTGSAYSDVFPTGPAVGPDGSLYFAGLTGKLVHGVISGGTNWNTSVTDTFQAAPVLDSGTGHLYLGGDTYVWCLNAANGSVVWQNFTGDGYTSPPALGSDGTIYFASQGGTVTAYTSGGTLKWQHATGGGVSCPPVIDASGTIFVGSNSGKVFAFSPSGTLLAETNNVGAQINGLAIGADQSLYVAGANGLYVLGVPTVASVSTNPSIVIGSIGSTGTVNLTGPSPATGTVVNLNSNSSYVTVPASVTIPGGATSVTFAISTTQAPASFAATITASYLGTTQTATLEVYANYVLGLTVSPTKIVGGSGATGTVSVYLPAATGGYVVNLSTEYPSAVGVPATVTVPAGAKTATFPISSARSRIEFGCDIYASDGTSGTKATLTITGDSVLRVNLNPSNIGGNQTSTGTVTLSSTAPAGGWVVNLSTEYPGSVSVPATVTVLAGSSSVNFTITPLQQLPNTTLLCDIYANDGPTGAQARLTVQGDSLTSVSVSPTSVVGGTSCTGTVTLTAKAPPGGWKVNLSTEYPTVDTVPASILVPSGSLSANFTITTLATGADYTCDVYASDGHSGKQATLTITHS